MLHGVITEVEDISDEEFPDFRVHALIGGQMQVFRVWLRTFRNEWAVYGEDGRQYVSAFPTRTEAMEFIGRAA